jgi:hypothetical protein
VATFKRLGLLEDKAGAVITTRAMMNGAVLKSAAVVGLFLIPYVPFIEDTFSLTPSGSKFLLAALIGLIALGGLITFSIVLRQRRKPENEEEDSGKERSEERGRLAKTCAKILKYVNHVLDSLVWIWREEPRAIIAYPVCTFLWAIIYLTPFKTGMCSLIGSVAFSATPTLRNSPLVTSYTAA